MYSQGHDMLNKSSSYANQNADSKFRQSQPFHLASFNMSSKADHVGEHNATFDKDASEYNPFHSSNRGSHRANMNQTMMQFTSRERSSSQFKSNQKPEEKHKSALGNYDFTGILQPIHEPASQLRKSGLSMNQTLTTDTTTVARGPVGNH